MVARPANPRLAEDILRVTAEIVEEKGPDKITMREVAERLGYSATTIYLYYKDKDELIQATLDHAFDWFADAMQNAESGQMTAEDLRVRSHVYATWAIDHPGMYRLMFEYPSKRPLDPERAQRRRRGLSRGGEIIDAAIERGELRCFENLQLMEALIWSTLHGIASLVISGRMFGPLGVVIGTEEAKTRCLAMVDASFEQWMRVWGSTSPDTNEFGLCGPDAPDCAECG